MHAGVGHYRAELWSLASSPPHKASSNRPKKTFWSHCLKQSPEKNFLGSLPQAIARKKLFGAIASSNRQKKTFSSHCLKQSREKNFFGPLPQAIARKKLFRLIVSYNGEKKTFWAHCLRQSREKNFFGPLSQTMRRHEMKRSRLIRSIDSSLLYGRELQALSRAPIATRSARSRCKAQAHAG